MTSYASWDAASSKLIATELPIGADAGAPWEAVRDELFYKRGAPYADASEFSYPSPYAATAPELAEFARASFAPDRPVVAAAVELMHRIHEEFTFDPGSTTIATPVTRVLTDRRGVCQDFAHLQIGCLRSLGLAARYVSGYLLTEPPPGQPRLVGADASHAWLSIWCPRLGWVDLDPTNDVLPSHRHVTLAWGRDYGDVSPLRGVVLGGRTHTLARRRQRDAGDGRRRVAGSSLRLSALQFLFRCPEIRVLQAGVTVGRPRAPPPGVDGMMSLPRAGCERCADIFSKPDATVWAWLCSCTALTRGTAGTRSDDRRVDGFGLVDCEGGPPAGVLPRHTGQLRHRCGRLHHAKTNCHMKTKRFDTPRPLLNWILQRGRDILAFQVRCAGGRYEVSASSPLVRKRVYARSCGRGPSALRLHAALVAGFREAGWTSIAYR